MISNSTAVSYKILIFYHIRQSYFIENISAILVDFEHLQLCSILVVCGCFHDNIGYSVWAS